MKAIVLIALLLVTGVTHCQEFLVKPDGLCSEEDPTKDYVAIDAGDVTAAQLYTNTIAFIKKNIRKREKAIVDKAENEYLEFEMYKRDAIAIDTGRPVAMVTIGGNNNTSGIRNTNASGLLSGRRMT